MIQPPSPKQSQVLGAILNLKAVKTNED